MPVNTQGLAKTARNRKGAAPAPQEVSTNLNKPAGNGKVPLQLKISPELRREVKTYAVERDLEVSTLFAQVWAFYREQHG